MSVYMVLRAASWASTVYGVINSPVASVLSYVSSKFWSPIHTVKVVYSTAKFGFKAARFVVFVLANGAYYVCKTIASTSSNETTTEAAKETRIEDEWVLVNLVDENQKSIRIYRDMNAVTGNQLDKDYQDYFYSTTTGGLQPSKVDNQDEKLFFEVINVCKTQQEFEEFLRQQTSEVEYKNIDALKPSENKLLQDTVPFKWEDSDSESDSEERKKPTSLSSRVKENYFV